MSALSRGKHALKSSISKTGGHPVISGRPSKISRRHGRTSPDSDAQFWCETGLDKDGFEKKFISKCIGFGVFTTKSFLKGEFLLEYCGGRKTQEELTAKDWKNHNFLFGYVYNNKSYWIDGSESNCLCKFVNDAENGTSMCNTKMKLKIFNQYPRLCLFASRDIPLGEELRYDYGDDPDKLFWRHQATDKQNNDEEEDDDPFDLKNHDDGGSCDSMESCLVDDDDDDDDGSTALHVMESHSKQYGEDAEEPSPEYQVEVDIESKMAAVNVITIDDLDKDDKDDRKKKDSEGKAEENGGREVGESTVVTTAQKGKEKREREKQKKAMVAATKAQLQARKEEEERLQRKEEEHGEEKIRQMEEEKRREKERKDNKRQKERNRKQQKGTLLTDKQKQDKRWAKAMKTQGFEIRSKDSIPKKRHVYSNKKKPQQNTTDEEEDDDPFDLKNHDDGGSCDSMESCLVDDDDDDDDGSTALHVMESHSKQYDFQNIQDNTRYKEIGFLQCSDNKWCRVELQDITFCGLMKDKAIKGSKKHNALDEDTVARRELNAENQMEVDIESTVAAIKVAPVVDAAKDDLENEGGEENDEDTVARRELNAENQMEVDIESTVAAIKVAPIVDAAKGDLENEGGEENDEDTVARRELNAENQMEVDIESTVAAIKVAPIVDAAKDDLENEGGEENGEDAEEWEEPSTENQVEVDIESKMAAVKVVTIDILDQDDKDAEENEGEKDDSFVQGQVQKVLHSGPLVINMGFFKLFRQFEITENPDDADILIMPASENRQAVATIEAFQCLLGRKVKCVSKKWIKDSLNKGTVQNWKKYVISSFQRYGEYTLEEDYQAFEFQVRGNWKEDMKEDLVRSMLQKMGGIEVINPSEKTVIVCADGHIHTSSKCVSKEWMFQSIIEGTIIKEDAVKSLMDTVPESDDESRSDIIGFQAFQPGKKIMVQTSGARFGKRLQKRQACVYCGELKTKLSRHLATQHSNEVEVAKILNLKKKSKERKHAWAELTAKGNYLHNMQVINDGSGMLIPKYRPTENKKERKYLPCEYCRAHIVSRDLWKHHQSCISKPKGIKSDGPVQNSRLLMPVKCSDQLKSKVVSDLRDDVVAEKVKSDLLIIEFGQRKFDKSGKHEHTHQYIRDRMRELGRFVIAMQELDSSVLTLSQCISPTVWPLVLKAVKQISGFDYETQIFSSPSLALKVGHSLSKCAKLLRTEAIQKEDKVTLERAKLFLDLFKGEWEDRISSLALESLSSAKYNTVQLLPLVEDVAKLSTYIKQEKKVIQQGDVDCDSNHVATYSRYCKLLLSEVILFNRRRSGEAQRLKIKAFSDSLLNANVDQEVKKSLTHFEQTLCETHIRIETRGKRGRKVAVLLTKNMKEDIEYLIGFHKKLNIQSEYIFVQPNSSKPYRGTQVLKEIAEQSDLKHPERITSTNLRKHLATMSQLLGLSRNHEDILAKFMGHDIRIHRDFYRLPQNTIEVAKVSKVLHLVNCGKISDIAGKNFDDIDILEPVDTEEDEEDETDDEMAETRQTRKRDTEEDEEDDTDDEMAKTRQTRKRGLQSSYCKQVDDYDDDNDENWRPSSAKRQKVYDEDDDEDEVEDFKHVVPVGKKNGRRHTWTKEEKRCVETAFRKHLALKRLPGKHECEQLLETNDVLQKRTWRMVKDFVRNKIVSMDRKLQKLK